MKNKIVLNHILSIVYSIFSLVLLSSSAQLRAETINSYDEFTIFNENTTFHVDKYLSTIGVNSGNSSPFVSVGSLNYAHLSGYAEFDIFSRSPRESIFLTFTIENISRFGRNDPPLVQADSVDLGVNFYDPLSLSTSNRYILTAKNPRELQYGSHYLFENSRAKLYRESIKIDDTISIDITKEFNLAVEAKLFDLGVKFSFRNNSNVLTLGNIRLTDNDLTSEN